MIGCYRVLHDASLVHVIAVSTSRKLVSSNLNPLSLMVPLSWNLGVVYSRFQYGWTIICINVDIVSSPLFEIAKWARLLWKKCNVIIVYYTVFVSCLSYPNCTTIHQSISPHFWYPLSWNVLLYIFPSQVCSTNIFIIMLILFFYFRLQSFQG